VSECDGEASIMKRPWPGFVSKCHRKPRETCSSNLGPWEPSQHLLEDRGKPKKCLSKWVVTGPPICILISSQQSAKRRRTNFYHLTNVFVALLIILIYILTVTFT